MALSWNEIKDRALRFTKEWEGESRERAEKDTFWNDFFNVFGISRRRLATFEEPVKKLNNAKGFIDLFWKGTLLVEHKSKGRSLDAAFEQATDYFHGIKEHELPKYVLVSDFENFRLYDLDEKTEHSFHLSDFHKNIKLFGFIAGYQKRSFKDEDEVNIAAAELMGKLHDQLEDSGYQGHDLEVYLVRLLFCLFADDTGIFEKDTFKEFIEVKTAEDGSNLGAMMAQLFQVLNTPREKRMSSLDEHLAAFPYVNGKLFEEFLMIPAFNSRMREILLLCSALNWGKISPAIFGSMFQSVMDPKERRNLGAHYTSEKNILKLIKPLFLDELWEEFHKIKGNKRQLQEFQMRLGKLKFLDPACGCGNFLIITYRELRLLELEVMKEIYKGQQAIGIQEILCVDVDQFYGIEYDEFPAKIAEVALWLMDHQMNLRVSEEFGLYYARLPLKKSAKIVHGNALQINWEDVVPKEELSFILGNPPFYGKQYQSKVQKEDMAKVFKGVDGAGVLDYVSAWYLKASALIVSSKIRVAFVSTNSISQGEQTGVLWGYLVKNFGVKINFAHQTFNWKNEAKGNAAVHVVIIGFSVLEQNQKKLFIYDNINGDPIEVRVKRINPYLVEGRDNFVQKRTKPLCDVPEMNYGSMPNDGGFLLFSENEKVDFLSKEPESEKFFRQFVMGEELINKIPRYCLWLESASPVELKGLIEVRSRVESVYQLRKSSTRAATNKLADYPMRFGEVRQPKTDYIALPRVSSVNRKFIPIDILRKEVIAGDKVYTISSSDRYLFGVVISTMHMAWMRVTSGRLKSDYSYSTQLTYNNFPWPKNPSDKNKALVEEKAQKVLDTRAKYPDSSLADLYDPLLMPPDLVKAHQELDRAVDQCYRPQPFTTEMARIEYLFELYEEYLTPLLGKGRKK
ncbi:MAG: class I SAM-dependent DNA methyltransferase [Algoriphagus aquaeductus]|uniref:class I SAM-dependent DNA methyltransferase n=1 Tax=Algoriphagus aquaeductus TaxID=475299 RepID=UPI0038796710